MLWVSPDATGSGAQLLTVGPSLVRTRSTVGGVASAPVTRNEYVTARRAPTYARVRLVPVSTLIAEPLLIPGTSLSTGLGAGGGGGRIASGLVGFDLAFAAVTAVT